MYTVKLISTALLVALMLGACSREEQPEGVIPEGYKSAVDKANSVEGTLEDAMQAQAREIDASER